MHPRQLCNLLCMKKSHDVQYVLEHIVHFLSVILGIIERFLEVKVLGLPSREVSIGSELSSKLIVSVLYICLLQPKQILLGIMVMNV